MHHACNMWAFSHKAMHCTCIEYKLKMTSDTMDYTKWTTVTLNIYVKLSILVMIRIVLMQHMRKWGFFMYWSFTRAFVIITPLRCGISITWSSLIKSQISSWMNHDARFTKYHYHSPQKVCFLNTLTCNSPFLRFFFNFNR